MASFPLSVVIHGHFYQPPRDDPWLEAVEAQPSAAPHHDWNERITEECYRAVLAARIPGPGGGIESILNTLEFLSFNFGPTLLDWMEKAAPRTYQQILQADAKSAERTGGFGNAIAQAYHHTILPLASRREKVTEVRWGILDFRRRFGREPAGIWLPETAADSETLDVLAQENLSFTILAPHQVKDPPPHGLPGLYRTSSGRTLAVFVYNGPLSHGVAFGPLLSDAEQWAKDILSSPLSGPATFAGGEGGLREDREQQRMVAIATDGETYGHHHRFGEMALASVIRILMEYPRVRLENFASFLFRNPPVHEIELVEPSSWSCTHGVERWRSDCGCKIHPEIDSQQQWRLGLREAMEWLAAQIHQIFAAEGSPLLGDPWAARDQFGPWGKTDTENVRALELLELERQSLRLFTSCGWFFDDLARIEPLQVLRYAARALELVGPRQDELEAGFLERLEKALSNESPPRTGREIFLEEAKPRVPAHLRVAGGSALWQAVAKSSGTHGDGPLVPRVRKQWKGSPNQSPGVPGFLVEENGPNNFRVTHKRTRRSWEVETQIRRPSSGRGAIAVRDQGGEFVTLKLEELPEGFRTPLIQILREAIPNLEEELILAVDKLKPASGFEATVSDEKLSRVLNLAELHILLDEPIPFEAQTSFFEFLQAVGPDIAQEAAHLRELLGFTPAQ